MKWEIANAIMSAVTLATVAYLVIYATVRAAQIAWALGKQAWRRANTYAKRPVPARQVLEMPELPAVLRRTKG